MAKKNVKIKGAWFNLALQEEVELCKHADSLNFSDWVKQKLSEDKLLKEQGPSEESKLDPNEIAALVETLVETKLAGRIIAVDQVIKHDEIQVDLDQFF
jgi:Asp-tRNA(Asn)/Glu-tRNA(Gln) amidotransferase B subunit